jgi:hypothetical protein
MSNVSWADFVVNDIPCVDENTWKLLLDINSIDDIIDDLTNWIVENNVPFPSQNINEQECLKRFKELFKNDLKSLWVNEKPVFTLDYENPGESFGILQIGHYYNIISDLFQRKNRMKCGSYTKYSPYAVWTGMGFTKDEHKKILRQALSGLKNEKKLDYTGYRACMRLGSNVYTAPQFRVHAAKQIYQYFNAKNIIDFSAGWGDRLAAFFATPGTVFYLGIDPNIETYSTYIEQCKNYDKWRADKNYKEPVLKVEWDHFVFKSESTGITVIIYNLPAEDTDLSIYTGTFDLAFTSPPYYCIEKYAEHLRSQQMQSWYRYNTPDLWLQGFLKPVVQKVKRTLKTNGILAINITDPVVNKKRGGRVFAYNCLREALKDMTFIGNIGLRTIKRPNIKIVDKLSCEPIWIWRN